jgi:hypothetical protein
MFIIGFLFYAPALMLDQFNFNIFIDGLVVGFSEFVVYPIAYFAINKLPRKRAGVMFFALALVCSIVLIFIAG